MDVKKEFKKAALGVLYITLFITTVRYFAFNVYQTYSLLIIMNAVFMIYKKQWKTKTYIKNGLYLAVIFAIMRKLGYYSWIGWIISILLISGLILCKKRKKFIEIKHHIETMLFGKPLKDIEGKPPKIKLVLKK